MEVKKAFAYLRTSSATNVGPDKDSDKRQLDAIHAYAGRNSLEIVRSFYDAGVSGADQISDRKGFRDMLEEVERSQIGVVLVESPDRFARDLIVQLLGHELLKKKGVQLIPTTAPDFFVSETPTAVMVRQILGAVAEFEKNSTVGRLRSARDRASAVKGERVEGRKADPRAVEATVAIISVYPQFSLRHLATKLSVAGFNGPRGVPYNTSSVRGLKKRALRLLERHALDKSQFVEEPGFPSGSP